MQDCLNFAPENFFVFESIMPACRVRTAILCLFIVALYSLKAFAQNDTLKVVNWNIEYFGDPHHHKVSVEANGVSNMLQAMNADIYAFCEVVDTGLFASVITGLPGNYGYTIAQFGSFAANASDPQYPSAQKLAFAYRKDIVRILNTRPLLSGSSTAYASFSSGRFPYLVSAEILSPDNYWIPVQFIIIHAKAYTDQASCMRRTEGCAELKDTLDAAFSHVNFLLLGDFNDDLDTSICDASTLSNYSLLVNDSAHYKALTLPISLAGAFSIDGYSSLIDHVIASDELAKSYVPGSAISLRTLAKQVDPNYDNDISDHFPIMTSYILNRSLASPSLAAHTSGIPALFPNPARNVLHVVGDFIMPFWVSDVTGKRLIVGLQQNSRDINIEQLAPGSYFLHTLNTSHAPVVLRFVKMD